LLASGKQFRGKTITLFRKVATRIENRFAPSAARWLRTARAPGQPDYFLAQQFDTLLHLLKTNNCSFHSCAALGSNPIPYGVSFRYDIHLRDLAPAHDFLALHLREQIPATFFLLWDYSRTERARLKQYLAFAAKVKPPVTLGLHDSPTDAFLIETKFSGDAKAHRRWTASNEVIAWLEDMAAQPEHLAAFHAGALEHLKMRVRRSCEHFGNVNTSAAHGGELVQNLRARLPGLEPPLRELATSLFAPNWLTPVRASEAGLMANIDNYGGRPSWKEESDGGGSRHRLMERIARTLSGGRALQILIHPYAWLKRD
jgi:hypothetical protein